MRFTTLPARTKVTATMLLTLAPTCAPLVAFAQESDRPNLAIGRVSDAQPIIDGVVDDAVWNDVQPFSTFVQQEPTSATPIRFASWQASTFSSNIRLALLNRSGTGCFLVYNDRRDTFVVHARGAARPFVRREIHATV